MTSEKPFAVLVETATDTQKYICRDFQVGPGGCVVLTGSVEDDGWPYRDSGQLVIREFLQVFVFETDSPEAWAEEQRLRELYKPSERFHSLL